MCLLSTWGFPARVRISQATKVRDCNESDQSFSASVPEFFDLWYTSPPYSPNWWACPQCTQKLSCRYRRRTIRLFEIFIKKSGDFILIYIKNMANWEYFFHKNPLYVSKLYILGWKKWKIPFPTSLHITWYPCHGAWKKLYNFKNFIFMDGPFICLIFFNYECFIWLIFMSCGEKLQNLKNNELMRTQTFRWLVVANRLERSVHILSCELVNNCHHLMTHEWTTTSIHYLWHCRGNTTILPIWRYMVCQFQQHQNQHEKNECNHYKLISVSQKCWPIVLIMNDMTINCHNSSLTSSAPTTVCC